MTEAGGVPYHRLEDLSGCSHGGYVSQIQCVPRQPVLYLLPTLPGHNVKLSNGALWGGECCDKIRDDMGV